MTAGGVPLVQVFVDDGTGTFPYEVTSRTRVGATVTRGRQDELAQVTPGALGLTLENDDGRFTLGSTTIATPSPIKVDQRIRTKVTPGGNLLTAVQASFETGTAGFAFNTLFGARDAGASIATSLLHPTDGTNSLLLTWSTTVIGNTALISVPTVPGTTYTLAMDVFVPVGSPDVRATAAFIANGATVSTKGATVRTSVTFTAGSAASSIGIECLSATAGQQCFIDSLVLTVGTTALPFAPGGMTVTRYTGYVQQWPVEWPSGSDLESTVSITATDAQARAERQTLRSMYVEEVTRLAPASIYLLNEPATSAAAGDTSGNNGASLVSVDSGTAVAFGATMSTGAGAATFAGGQYLTGPTALASGGVAFLFQRASAPAVTEILWAPQGETRISVGMDSTGRVGFPGDSIWSTGTYGNAATHSAVVRILGGSTELYIDGALVATDARALGTSSSAYLGGIPGSSPGITFTGLIGGVATWATAPTAVQAAALSSAALTNLAGESGTARLTRLAGYASIPVGTLDASLTNVGGTDITGKSDAEALRQVADAEFGLVFFDGSGSLTFHNRNRVASKLSPDLTLTADVLDPGTAFIVDMQGILNYYTVTATGTNAAQVVFNAASQTTHGRYPGSATYLVQTDAEALDRGSWTVYTHAEPLARVGSLVIDAMVLDPATQATLLALEPNSWVRITGLPSQAPGGTTADFIVQGFADKLGVDSWQIAFNAANKAVAAPTPFILDNATFGVLDTNRLYV